MNNIAILRTRRKKVIIYCFRQIKLIERCKTILVEECAPLLNR